jgi:hypothetical protein
MHTSILPIASNFKSNYYEVELKLDVLESEN